MQSRLKTILTLWAAGVISTAAGMPYIFELQRDLLSQAEMPLATLALLSLAQTAVFLAVAVSAGVWFAERAGLTVIPKDSVASEFTGKRLWFYVWVGLWVALALILADIIFRATGVVIETGGESISLWKSFLASFYGGVVEELLLRLFLMSALVWLFGKFTSVGKPAEDSPIVWTAIIVAALLFGLGHLPVTASLTELTPLIVLRGLVLNGIGGLVFGWLYWKRGLIPAIITHFATDIGLLVLLPIILRLT